MSTAIHPGAAAMGSDDQTSASPRATVPERDTRLLLSVIELGILGDLLLRAGGIGVNITLWCWALLIAGGLTARDIAIDRQRRWLLGAAAGFALVPSVRADEMLIFLAGVSVILCLALLTWTAGAPETRLFARTTGAYIGALWTSARHIVAGIVPLVAGEVRARSHLAPVYGKPVGAMVRGVLLAVPVLFVFASLLVSADAAYASLMGRLFRWDVETVVSHVVLTGIFAWLAAAYLHAPRRWAVYAPAGMAPGFRIGAIEAGTVVALVDALFLSFVLVQARYLFGGTDHVLQTAGLTYAEYARRGFFELVAVCGLALPLLVLIVSGTRVDSLSQRRTHKVLVGVLIALLLLMMASALRRMWLYQAEYGWTLARVHATAFMLWIGGSILWFAATALREAPQRFTLGSIAGGLAVLGVLVVTNPAAAIVRANAERVAIGKDFDGIHAAEIGVDGLPALLEVLPRVAASLDERERCAIRRRIQGFVDTDAPGGRGRDWRVLNLARIRAREALDRHGAAAAELLGGSGRCPSSA